MPRFQDVWLIPTPHGDAIRGCDEMKDNGDGCFSRIGVAASSIIPVTIPRSDLRTVPFLPSDLPDPLRSKTEVYNVCGFVVGFSAVSSHPAWRTVHSTLGYFKEAYTLRAGNLIFLRGKLVFKGAVSWQVCLFVCRNIARGIYSDANRESIPPCVACLPSPASRVFVPTWSSPQPTCSATYLSTTDAFWRRCYPVFRGAA